jgi:hypothetical protein
MSRSLSVFALILTLGSIARCAEPNTLIPLHVADGHLLLFDGKTTFGWESEGGLHAKDGALLLGPTIAVRARPTTVFGDCRWAFEYRLDQTAMPAKKPSLIRLKRGKTEHVTTLAETGSGADRWFSVAQSWIGKDVLTFVTIPGGQRGGPLLESTQGDPSVREPLKIQFEVPEGSLLALRNFTLQPAGLQSIFNGKDLSGWKLFTGPKPAVKSQFTVTPEGWLNIKNGPGDLQTEGQWANFILQLECISNGQHLNSGVFFRCRPDEYQQGYEAQIRNQFTPDPTQEYALDQYDPRTGKVIGKKLVKLQAVDFGTGAIYRRQPARRPVAKDGEWFTLTVLAHDRHLATWVNGIQVTDWTDYRPLADNARNGCRLEKGAISLQGHDPTTDLSFRNFRIAELPK